MVFVIVLLLIAIGVSSWMIAQEQSTADTIRERAQSAGTNDDPVSIVADQARYRGLDERTLQDPATGDKALIHRPEFGQQLMGMVQEYWPRASYPQTVDSAVTEPDAGAAAHFSLAGSAPGSSDRLSVKAPPGTVDSQGRTVTGHQVWLSHGWLVVGDYVGGAYQPARPATVLNFVDSSGTPGVVSIRPRRKWKLAAGRAARAVWLRASRSACRRRRLHRLPASTQREYPEPL